MEKAGSPARSAQARLRRRVRHERRARPAARSGAQGREGLREGAEEPRQEHDAPGEHGTRRDGAVPGGGGRHDRGPVRGVRREGARPVALARAGGRDGQPLRPQGGAGARARGGRGLRGPVLAAYSPDFSPIEEAFSKLKARLRKEKARTKEALVEAIGRALDAVSERDARGWFAHCGYPAQSL